VAAAADGHPAGIGDRPLTRVVVAAGCSTAGSLATPSLLADRYGTTAYASIAGTLATPVTLAKAGAPLGAAALYTLTGSYPPVLVAIGIACPIAAGGILARSTAALPSTPDADATGTTGHSAAPSPRTEVGEPAAAPSP
jgi:hypothetical protein